MAGSYEFLRRHGRSGEALIIDEGFVHRVVQLHASTVERPERRQVARYVESLPLSDLLVLVRAPLGVCQQRVRTRGVWRRLQHRDDDDINRFVSNAHLAIAFAADALRGGVRPMVEIDNAGDLARAEITLKERLEEALSGSGSGPAAGSGAGPGEEAPWTSPRVRVPRMARVVDRIVDLLIVLSRVRLDRGQAFMAGYRKRTAIAADEWRDLFDVWEYDRLTGLVHSWRNHVTLGGEQRLVTARARVIEAEWAREQAGGPWR